MKKETSPYLDLTSVNPGLHWGFIQQDSSPSPAVHFWPDRRIIKWHCDGLSAPPDLAPSLVFELVPPLSFVYCHWANFWALQLCSLSRSIWINFARNVFELLWSRLSHLVIFSSTVFVILLKSYHVCGLWLVLFFYFNNPGLMQPHNSFVSLGCVQFVNLCCRRTIKTVRHRPC